MQNEQTCDAAFIGLRGLLSRHGRHLHVVVDTPDEFQLASRTQRDRLGRPLFVMAVQRKKNYVSFHFMPVYTDPTLRDSLSPALRRRMQGKSCFNFRTIEPAELTELGRLVREGLDRFKAVKLPWNAGASGARKRTQI